MLAHATGRPWRMPHAPPQPPAVPRPPPPLQVAAASAIPLKGLLRQRRLGGSWRLKEATAGVAEADRLDLGRATVQLAWFPLQAPCGGGGELGDGDGEARSPGGSLA